MELFLWFVLWGVVFMAGVATGGISERRTRARSLGMTFEEYKEYRDTLKKP